MTQHMVTQMSLLTKLNEWVGPHGTVDALGVIGDDELSLQLIQETEGQDVGVGLRAHHHVAHAQRAGEAEHNTPHKGGGHSVKWMMKPIHTLQQVHTSQCG